MSQPITSATDCATCTSAPSVGIPGSWLPVGEVAGVPDWARRLQVHRCRECGRYWDTPYDPKDGVHYPATRPLDGTIGRLLAARAPLADLFSFMKAEGVADGGASIAQAYLLEANYDVLDAVEGLVALTPDRPTEFHLLLLLAALQGRSGIEAWKEAAYRPVKELSSAVRSRLDTVLASKEDSRDRLPLHRPQAIAEIRRRLDHIYKY